MTSVFLSLLGSQKDGSQAYTHMRTHTLSMLKLKVVLSRKIDWFVTKDWGKERTARKITSLEAILVIYSACLDTCKA